MKFLSHIFLIFAPIVGCSGRPGAVGLPNVDPSTAAGAAIDELDRSGDGQLSKDEWSASAPLASVATQYDGNQDGNLSSDEIAAGIARWIQTGVGARQVPFTVVLDGRGLSGATVRLVPAPFLGLGLKGAFGETSASGSGMLNMAPEDRPKNAPNIPLMQPGLYEVQITHPARPIPAKYNTQTTLGIEISSGNPPPQGVTWSLVSK